MGGPGSGRRGLSRQRVTWIEARLARGHSCDTISQIARDERLNRKTIRRIRDGLHVRQQSATAPPCPLCARELVAGRCPTCGWQAPLAA